MGSRSSAASTSSTWFTAMGSGSLPSTRAERSSKGCHRRSTTTCSRSSTVRRLNGLADLRTAPVETPDESAEKPKRRRPLRRSLWLLIGLVAGFVVYAYGFYVVDVRLDRLGE